MTTPPQGWVGDPEVDAGFAAAYAPPARPALPARPASGALSRLPVPLQPVVTPRDEAEEQADLAARRLTADGRRVRAPEPDRLSPRRAVTGAAVSLAGVCLGIGTLLWVSGDPLPAQGPTAGGPLPLSSPPVETELSPVDPPAAAPVPPVTAAAPAAPLPPVVAGPVAPAAAPVPSVVVPITVLNNSNRTGLADRAAARFERGGWPVRLSGNFRGRIPVTTVYYDDGFEASARAFARDFEGIARVRPRFATLPARGVVVVLTREFGA